MGKWIDATLPPARTNGRDSALCAYVSRYYGAVIIPERIGSSLTGSRTTRLRRTDPTNLTGSNGPHLVPDHFPPTPRANRVVIGPVSLPARSRRRKSVAVQLRPARVLCWPKQKNTIAPRHGSNDRFVRLLSYVRREKFRRVRHDLLLSFGRFVFVVFAICFQRRRLFKHVASSSSKNDAARISRTNATANDGRT